MCCLKRMELRCPCLSHVCPLILKPSSTLRKISRQENTSNVYHLCSMKHGPWVVPKPCPVVKISKCLGFNHTEGFLVLPWYICHTKVFADEGESLSLKSCLCMCVCLYEIVYCFLNWGSYSLSDSGLGQVDMRTLSNTMLHPERHPALYVQCQYKEA